MELKAPSARGLHLRVRAVGEVGSVFPRGVDAETGIST